MHIQTILQSQVLFGHTRPALRPWLRKLWPPSRSAFKRRAIGRKRCGDGSNFRGERPGKHLGGFHDGWFIMENPMKISHVPKPLVVFGPKKYIYIYIIHIYLSIYLYTHLFCSGEPDVLWFPTRLWALFSREPTVLHLKCSRHGIRDLDKFTSAGHHCVNAHVYVYIDTIHCIHTQYIYIHTYTHTYYVYDYVYYYVEEEIKV